MTLQEIREIAINSAEVYYKYLADNDKGLQTIEVFEMTQLRVGSSLHLTLRLSAKIVDTESISIKLKGSNQKYAVVQSITKKEDENREENNQEEEVPKILFVHYNEDKHILKVEIDQKITKEFAGIIKSRDIQVVSDLKFLVRRVRDWYERNGAKLALPTQSSVLSVNNLFNEIEYLEGLEPSENQKQSLYNIFNTPFSYIWGAPGTGKTQFVLAYAVLHYIRSGQRVAILAPTNNALEQVLRGVVKMTDLAGIPRHKIVRMGKASQAFAEEFPELCPHIKKKVTVKEPNMFADELPVQEKKEEENVEFVKNVGERLNVHLIGCTLDYYAGEYNEKKMNVQHIFLDEAGYANMIKACMLFNHKVPITFLGDHAQLPPVCELNDFSIEKEREFENMFLWAQSAIYIETLFSLSKEEVRYQYLKNSTPELLRTSKTLLNTTYRFGESLAKVLAFHVYSLEFSSGKTDGNTKISFIHASKQEGFKSRTSVSEVVAIKFLTTILKHKGVSDYAILTPYKKQVKLLSQHLPDERKKLKILTVHGSQGREWDTVIVSVADTSDKWFVDSLNPASRGLNLVNTAVSRARKELIIVCDTEYWRHQHGQLISDLVRIGKEIKMESIF